MLRERKFVSLIPISSLHSFSQVEADNRWIVTYNPYLLAKYESHINVEAVSKVHVVKYIYKYIFKVSFFS